MADNNEFIVRILGYSVVQGRRDGFADVCPRTPEAEFGFTPTTEVRVGVDEGEVRQPAADGVAAAEGEDDGAVRVVDC